MMCCLLATTLPQLAAHAESRAAATLTGVVTDRENGEPLIGAYVKLLETGEVTATGVDGDFTFERVPSGKVTLEISYTSYNTERVECEAGQQPLAVSLLPDNQMLSDVVVTGRRRGGSEAAVVYDQQTSLVTQVGVSSQQITRTQDKDASEVIRRVPGISIIDGKFVMVRGLPQRYNNVWMNGAAVPSSEADSRSFSFDILPSSQLENLVVVKSSAPEYPADFSGGMIMIRTKNVPDENSFSIGAGLGVNDRTQFNQYFGYRGSSTDWLGFDGGTRSLRGGINGVLNPLNNGVSLTGNGFNNDWTVRRSHPTPDMSLNMSWSWRKQTEGGSLWAMLAALNYNSNYRTFAGMDNNMFGAYDVTNDCPNYLRRSIDDQYNHSNRIGVMYNVTMLSADGNHRFEFNNLLNQLGRTRYTWRKGIDAQSDTFNSAEYYYQSRTTYNGQLTGKHTLGDDDKLDWSAGYAYANRNMPDRRRYTTVLDPETGLMEVDNLNDINREYNRLDEHIGSAGVNYTHDFSSWVIPVTLKAGGYGQYRSRRYNTRYFLYSWPGGLPPEYRTMDVPTELMRDENYGADKLYLIEQVDWRNNYRGNDVTGAAYVGGNFTFGKFNAYAGVRYEYYRMNLTGNTRKTEESPKDNIYDYNDLFPSVNMAYRFDDRHVMRLYYGRTVNRPEFRELSTSVYYDFDLASNIQGNYDLRPAYVDNIDLGYSFYPSSGELLSVSLFYKHFRDPIEWTYTVAGGTDLIYSYVNAKGADNYGVEVDIRKSLDFIGMPDFSLNVNGALIKSRVTFEPGSKEHDRPMQGQSPYLINAGLFYRNERAGVSASLMYNRIGKRIVGVGRKVGYEGMEVKVPDSYEMPRNTIDINVTKTLGDFELRFGVRDLLAQKASFIQYENTARGEIKQVNRQYRPGRTLNLSFTYKFTAK